MIVWSGWGLLVIVFALLGLFAGSVSAHAIVAAAPLPVGTMAKLGMIIGAALSAAMIFFFARWRENQPARVFIDQATGQHIEVRQSAGSLFFIPMRFWTWIVLALSALMVISGAADTIDTPPP